MCHCSGGGQGLPQTLAVVAVLVYGAAVISPGLSLLLLLPLPLSFVFALLLSLSLSLSLSLLLLT